MGMISSIVLAAATLAILWWSRKSLLHPSSHGFPRFFAFESILALIVLSAPHWFANPFAALQIVSWVLLMISIVLVVWGVVLLHLQGKPKPVTDDSPEFDWENTGQLVTTGIYRYIRHPMYSSLLFLTLGALLKSISLAAVMLAVIACLAVVLAARAEEAENIARFGEAYRIYMRRTRRFLPFLL